MSISGADGSGSNSKDEIIRRNREEYQQKESELIKKHNRRIRQMNNQHYQEVQGMRERHDEKVKDIHKQVQINQARRDKGYQERTEKLRNMHRKQLQELAKDKQFQVGKERDARIVALDQLEKAHQKRVSEINKHHKQDAEYKEAKFNQALDSQRESQQKAIQDMRVRLEGNHDVEQKSTRDAWEKKYDNLATSHQNYREETVRQMREQKVLNLANRQRDSENLIATVSRERKAQEQARELMKEGFDMSLEKQKDRFLRAQQQKEMASRVGVENLKEDMQTKIRERTHRLEQKIADLESEKNIQESVLKKQAQNNLDSVKQVYARSLASANASRDEAFDDIKDQHAEDLHKIHDEKDKAFARQTRRLMSDQATENFRNRQAFENIESQFEGRVSQVQENADMRVETILEQETEKTQRIEKLYEEARNNLRDQQYQEIGELRNKFVAERQTAIESLKEQMRQRETQHSVKVNSMQRKHKKEVQALKDEMLKTKRSKDQNHKVTVESLVSQHERDKSSQEIRHKNQMNEIQESHRQEIAKINQRHEEQLNQILRTSRLS